MSSEELTDEILANAEKDTPIVEEMPEEIEQLNREQQLEEELLAMKDKWLRAHAELENVRKRAIREKKEASQYAVTSFARDMLEVSDNFKRALSTLPPDLPKDDPLIAFVDGVKLTEQQLISIFGRHNIQEIEANGKIFDPNFHQAMFEIPTKDVENNTVMQVVQGGFTISGRLLRPAMVGVAKNSEKVAPVTPPKPATPATPATPKEAEKPAVGTKIDEQS